MLVLEALSLAAGPGFVHLTQAGTLIAGLATLPTTPTKTFTAAQTLSVADGGKDTDTPPPSRVTINYNHVTVTQTAIDAATTDRRALIAAEARIYTVPLTANTTIYNDDAYPAGRVLHSPSRYIDETIARTEAPRLASVWEDPRPVYTVVVAGGYRSSYTLGSIVNVTDVRSGTATSAMVVGVESGPHTETIRVR